tara:strand:+ start:306 stop:425 length:120 start_codon:yes stop_codon:yes gene_type:complete
MIKTISRVVGATALLTTAVPILAKDIKIRFISTLTTPAA